MTEKPHGLPELRAPEMSDLKAALRRGGDDFIAAPLIGAFFSGFYVLTGLLMSWITYLSGQTFWLILAVFGFPLIGAFAALGLYETSRRRTAGEVLDLSAIANVAWSERSGQIPWFAAMIMVIFLFWFFLGHMIFALFLGLAPMTNISSSLDVFFTANGLLMLAFGTGVGAVFALLIFSMSVIGIPMLLDRDVDFMTAMLRSIRAVREAPSVYLLWGFLIGLITLLAMLPFFLGLFLALPVFGHATWHLYDLLKTPVTETD